MGSEIQQALSKDLPRYDWKDSSAPSPTCCDFAAKTGLSAPVANLLLARRLASADAPDAAIRFLEASVRGMLPPETMPGVTEAREKIISAIHKKGPIVIFGDFDCDGTVATAILTDMLRFFGADVRPFIPLRSDGYGLSEQAVERCLEETPEPALLITVDCGMGAGDALQRFLDLGCEVVVSDHHTPSTPLPPACTIVSTFNEGVPETCRDLCGAGVAYKIAGGVMTALYPAPDRTGRGRLYRWLDALAIATVADVVPLLGENRLYVREGLAIINHNKKGVFPHVGIVALLRETTKNLQAITSEQLGFILAPHINSAGRMKSAETALRLLLATDADEAKADAITLKKFNVDRRREEQKVLESSKGQLSDTNIFRPDEDGAIVIAGEGWHPGTIGIAAARICDTYRRPVVVIALEGESGRGSVRAPEGYNAYQALSACSGYLLHFGGHANAAGLGIAKAEIDNFRRAFAAECFRQVNAPSLRPELEISGWLEFGFIDEKLLESINRLEPYGMGNPPPCWALSDVTAKPSRMGQEQQHLRLEIVQGDSVRLKCIWFGAGEYEKEFKPGSRWDIAGTLSLNEFRGDREIELMVIDARPHV